MSLRRGHRHISSLSLYLSLSHALNSSTAPTNLVVFPGDDEREGRAEYLRHDWTEVVPDANRQSDNLGETELENNQHSHVALRIFEEWSRGVEGGGGGVLAIMHAITEQYPSRLLRLTSPPLQCSRSTVVPRRSGVCYHWPNGSWR